jgi:hypothetical protein
VHKCTQRDIYWGSRGHPGYAGPRPSAEAALLLCFAQQPAILSVDEMQSGAGWADDPLILVFGNIWIAIQLVLDVDANRRAPENKMGHQSGYDGPANRIMI